jgi:hypothetical protein
MKRESLHRKQPGFRASSSNGHWRSCCKYLLHIVAAQQQCNIYCLFSRSLRFWRVQYMGVMNLKRPGVIKGTMTHAKKSSSTEILAGAIISLARYLAPLRYATQLAHVRVFWPLPRYLLAAALPFVGHCSTSCWLLPHHSLAIAEAVQLI